MFRANFDRISWGRIGRSLCLGVAIGCSIFLWRLNNPFPASNRNIYIDSRKLINQAAALKSILRDLNAYGEKSPEFSKLLSEHHVEDLIGVEIIKKKSK